MGRSAAQSAPCGIFSSSTMMVMMMAITPSLNASRRPFVIAPSALTGLPSHTITTAGRRTPPPLTLTSSPAVVGHVEHVVAGDDAGDAAELFDEDGRVAAELADDFGGAGLDIYDGEARLHQLADRGAEQVAVAEHLGEQAVLAHRADRLALLDDGHLRDAVLVHLRERLGDRGRRLDGEDARAVTRGLRRADEPGRHLLWFEQALLLQPLVRVVLRQVVLAGVADDEDDDARLVQPARHLEGRGEVRPRRAAAEDALLAPELARHLERLAVGDVDDLVHVAHVHVGRDDLLPDAFDEVGRRLVRAAGLLVRLEDRAVRVRADDPDVRALLLQEPPRARDGAARAEPRDEVRDAPLGLLPQLRPRGAVVRLGVVRVGVLVRVEAVRRLARDAARGLDVVVGRAGLRGGRDDDHVRAERLQIPNF